MSTPFGGRATDWRLMEKCKARARLELIAGGFDRLSKKLPEATAKRAHRYYSEARA